MENSELKIHLGTIQPNQQVYLAWGTQAATNEKE